MGVAMNRRLTIRNTTFAVMLFLLVSGCAKAAWVGTEGEEWLRWDANTKVVFIRAFIQGMQSGFNRGCESGIESVQPQMSGGDMARATDACLAHFPISERDSSKLVGQITDFYRRYPKQRFLYISDIFLQLHAGRTIEQIHEHFPQEAN